MNERIEELRKQVDVDMHLHNLEDFRAMSGCFGLEGGNKIVDDYLDKFAELIVRECSRVIVNGGYWSGGPIGPKRQCTPPEIAQMIKEHFGVEE